MFKLTQLIGFGVGGVAEAPFSFAQVDTDVSALSNSTYDFTSISFGAAPGAGETRYIAVAAAGAIAGTASISSVTIGGVAAAEAVGTGATGIPRGVWVAEVPTGTSGTVQVAFDNTQVCAAIVVARLINPGNPLGHDTATAAHSGGTVTLSLDIPTDGGAIALCGSQNASTTTWTGLTELFDTDLNSGEFFTGASGTTAGTPRTVTADNADDTPSQFTGVACSWGP